MTDRRFLASNGRVADVALQGFVDTEEFVTPVRRGVSFGHWLHDAPEGNIDRELLVGDAFDVIEERGDWSFGRSAKDGYCGWFETAWLGPWRAPTHRIAVRTTWGYNSPDFKTPRVLPLHLSSGVTIEETTAGWAQIAVSAGSLWVPEHHLTQSDMDLIEAARLLLGTPYVWAGNSGFGIDCSGLVQVAFHAGGRDCPPDSDVQAGMSGRELTPEEPLAAGDLLFWKGHVAMATGPDTMIHANAHHMAVVEEPIVEAVARIASTDTGPVTRRLRPEL